MPIFCSNCGKENRDKSKFCNNCANPLQVSVPSGPLQAGTTLENRYKIITLIKAGGMGAVYKAEDEKLENICAIKELLPPVYGKQKEYKQIAEWFKREAKILAKLDHPNLPKVSDYFASKGRYYLVMNFIDGEDLETILHKEGKPGLQEEKVIEWAKQILNILEYLHNLQPPVIYRDIKPSNIMLHRDGRAMLIDFGIARSINQDSQTKKTAIGTSGYAPVEQCRGKAEPRSDLYALGATIHHLLTGVEPLPFKFDSLRKIVSGVSIELEKIVMKTLKENPKERFSSAKEMKEVFLNLSLKIQTESPPSNASQVNKYLKNKEISGDIVDRYKIVIDKNLDDFEARYDLGMFYKDFGELEKAIEQFQSLVKCPEKSLYAYNMLGLCFDQIGNGIMAINQFKKGLSSEGYRDEDYQELKYNLGLLYERRGMVREALAMYEEIFNVDIRYRDVTQRIQQLEELLHMEELLGR